jgi:hypothetical protein
MEQDAEFIRRHKTMRTVEIVILPRRIYSGIEQMIFVHIEKEFSEAVMQRPDTIKRFPPARLQFGEYNKKITACAEIKYNI